ncbi:MAG: HAD family hydrolase [Desulfatibacillaceae bacterium]
MAREMFVTDLDGTILQRDGTFAAEDVQALERLRERGVVRVLATGRSLYSMSKGVRARMPFDYVVFSTGAGVMSVEDRVVMTKWGHRAGDVDRAAEVLELMGLEYVVYEPVPDNHKFHYRKNGNVNPDFDWLCERYAEFCQPLVSGLDHHLAAQLLAVVPRHGGVTGYQKVCDALGDLSVIRTTSPTDGQSVWIEIFPSGVSKSGALKWLGEHLGVSPDAVGCVGNDYNDLDMLAAAGEAWVVAGAPDELRSRFPAVRAFDGGGVADAVDRWLKWRGLD